MGAVNKETYVWKCLEIKRPKHISYMAVAEWTTLTIGIEI